MQSKCNEYKRQQSEQYMWKTVDRWIWYSLCDHRKVKLKNGRPTNGLALSTQCDYSISTLFCLFDFHPNLNIHCFQFPSCFIQCSLVLWLRLCSREIVCTCQTFELLFGSGLLCSLTFNAKRIWHTDDKQGKKHNQCQKSHCSLATVRKRNSWRKMNPSDPSLTHYIIANSSADSYPAQRAIVL